MGRRSEMASLVDGLRASRAARERTKVMLLTLGGQWSVRDGYERLGMKRTRFQDLRRRMLESAVLALEDGVAGRPRQVVEGESLLIAKLRAEVRELEHEARLLRAQLDIAESGVGEVVLRRKEQMLARSAPGRTGCRYGKRRTGERSSCA